MSLLQQTADFALDGSGRATLTAGGAAFYGILLEPIEADSGAGGQPGGTRGYPADLYPDPEGKQSRRVTGPRALYFDAATAPVSLELDATPGGKQGDEWRVTFAMAPGEVLGQGGAYGVQGRSLVARGGDLLFALDRDQLTGKAPGTYWILKNGTLAVANSPLTSRSAAVFDLRQYERIELDFQEEAAPVGSDGPVRFVIRSQVSALFPADRTDADGVTCFKCGDEGVDFGAGGEKDGLLVLGGRRQVLADEVRRIYDCPVPPFATFSYVNGQTIAASWAAGKQVQLRVYGYPR